MKPVKICRIIGACAILHNIALLRNEPLGSGHMILKVMFHIPMKLKSELACASMTTSDVNNQWRSNFQ
jgi:hypothetical protein